MIIEQSSKKDAKYNIYEEQYDCEILLSIETTKEEDDALLTMTWNPSICFDERERGVKSTIVNEHCSPFDMVQVSKQLISKPRRTSFICIVDLNVLTFHGYIHSLKNNGSLKINS